ncbi:hypothetical protein, partial [Acinetobacter baumannii]
GEYMKQDPLWARDRDYPFNSYDWSRICNAGGSCLPNSNPNGINANGSVHGTYAVPGVALVRPVTTPGGAVGAGRFSYLN